MRERARTPNPVSRYSLSFVCPSPQSSASTGPRLFLLSPMPMRVPTQTKTQEREVVGLCQKSAGLCLQQTPQPRKTAHLAYCCAAALQKRGFWHSDPPTRAIMRGSCTRPAPMRIALGTKALSVSAIVASQFSACS